MKSPKAPKPTAQENAMIMRQGMQLDEEMAKNEKRLKAIARGGLGSKSMLGSKADAAAKEVSSSATKKSMIAPNVMSGFGGYR